MRLSSCSIVSLVVLLEILHIVSADVLPSIVVNPYNPVFSCDDLEIKVQLNDQLTFGCSIVLVHRFPRAGNLINAKIYENLYFLGTDKQAYDSCNATAMMNVLKCDPDDPTLTSNWIFRQHQTSQGDVTFDAGKTYYFIGTGYKTKSMLNNLVGGSCNRKEDNRYNIRLKIYVCTQAEINNGTCEQCKTDACYYKDCAKICSNWTTFSESIDDRTLYQSRLCQNSLLNENVTERRIIPAPQANCSHWTMESVKREGTNCTYFERGTCVNSLGQTVMQLREVQQGCVPGPSNTPVTGAPRTGGDDNEDTYTGIAVGASIFCFVIGIVLGGCCYKGHHQKTCSSMNNNIKPHIEFTTGIHNEGYARNSAFDDEYDGTRAKLQVLTGEESPAVTITSGKES